MKKPSESMRGRRERESSHKLQQSPVNALRSIQQLALITSTSYTFELRSVFQLTVTRETSFFTPSFGNYLRDDLFVKIPFHSRKFSIFLHFEKSLYHPPRFY